MSYLKEFKAFAMRGNVTDLAIGVVIGGAFGTIVKSLVGDIIMPIIGILTGGVDFSSLSFSVGDATIAYGKFIQAVVVFIIISFALFLIVKAINAAKKREEEAPTPLATPTKQESLLAEIRDLLKK